MSVTPKTILEITLGNNINLVAEGKADVMKMVSGIYSMENALDAFKALSNNDGTLAKLLIRIGE